MERNSSPDISFENNVFYYKGTLWILDNLQVKKDILEAEYDSKVAGHMWQDKTIILVRQNVFSLKLKIFIKNFVRLCLE